jgi:Spy/CpxP family protein refolding chaperone
VQLGDHNSQVTDEKNRILRESFQNDIKPLCTNKYERKAELSLLCMQMQADSKQIKAKQKELHNLRWQLKEKTTDYRLAFRDILTPEQLSKFLAFGAARDHHYPRGRGGRGDDFTTPGPQPRWWIDITDP